MTIAIIGTGNVGSGLAHTFSRSGHDVVVASKTAESAQLLAGRLAGEKLLVKALSLTDAVAAADVVVLAIPYTEVGNVAAAVNLAGKIVVDVTNPLVADFSGITVGFSSSAAEEIARTIPDARVVKAFNTLFAQIYEQGLDFGGRAAPTFVASDDAEAKAKVMEIARSAGFDAVDAGPLANARYLEPLGYMNIQFGFMLGHGTQIVPAWLSR